MMRPKTMVKRFGDVLRGPVDARFILAHLLSDPALCAALKGADRETKKEWRAKIRQILVAAREDVKGWETLSKAKVFK